MPRPAAKDRDFVRNVLVRVLVRRAERRRWAKRASEEGLTLSAWLRIVANRAARTG